MIVAINGEKVVTAADFLAIVESHQPGEEVIVTVVRDGHEMQVPLRLDRGRTMIASITPPARPTAA